jgi:hypothetical protein
MSSRTRATAFVREVKDFDDAQSAVDRWCDLWEVQHSDTCPMFRDPSWETPCNCGLIERFKDAEDALLDLARKYKP